MVRVSILSLALLACSVSAGTLKGNPEHCRFLGQQTAIAANDMRDAGMEWVEASTWLDNALAEAMGKESSIVQDEADAKLIRTVFKDVWDHPELEPYAVMIRTMSTCMGQKTKGEV